MNASVQLQELRRQAAAPQQLQAEPDYGVDLFSVRGFKLAHRLAEVFSSSDAVPAIFRSHTLKKGRDGSSDQWVENPAAIGNCVVAIETARSVGMSITSVMQHANIIEGRLSWSAQFIIAAINASHRFTPLRFDIKSRGVIKAKYREKLGWNKAKGGFDFADREVELDDLVCVAWAYMLDGSRPTKERIESAPVSMKMAVEEGWYSKAGSKWQTEMRHQMLQYRAGSFFGRIHAPDVVMGMGRSTEEWQDVTTVDVAPDGHVRSVTTEELRRAEAPAPRADVVTTAATADPDHDVQGEGAQSTGSAGVAGKADDWTPSPEEVAAIRARELAEAGDGATAAAEPAGAQQAGPVTRRRGAPGQGPE